MSRIDDIFAAARADGRPLLMPFLTAGYPDLACTERTLLGLADAGAAIVELGIPFSDPIADGPVIAASMHEALEAGVTPTAVLDLVARRRAELDLGVLAMLSASIVHRRGGADFIAAAAAAGIDGFIVPDLDLDAAPELVAAAEAHDVAFSMLIAPTTPPDRIAAIARQCRGFVYVLARVGITGERTDAPEVAERIAQIRAQTDLPVAVGFGISAAAHVAAVTASADAAIVGSALVRRMGEAADPAAAALAFVRELAGGLVRSA